MNRFAQFTKEERDALIDGLKSEADLEEAELQWRVDIATRLIDEAEGRLRRGTPDDPEDKSIDPAVKYIEIGIWSDRYKILAVDAAHNHVADSGINFLSLGQPSSGPMAGADMAIVIALERGVFA